MVSGLAEIRVNNIKRISDLKSAISVTRRKDFSALYIDKGYDYARNIAPQDKGHLKAAIQKIHEPNKQSGRIRVVQPSGSDRPYHMWMHGYKVPGGKGGKGYDLRFGWKRGEKHFKIVSGIPTFMFKTQEYLEAQTSKGIDQQIKQLFK